MTDRAEPIDLSPFPANRPEPGKRLLFIHHSCGGQLLADPGPIEGEKCIYATHPNAGSLRRALDREGYTVHEASYGSIPGDRTDIFDWLPKFRDAMEEALACAGQDTRHPEGITNDIIVFKPCFPNNYFLAEGTAPGNPSGPELTVRNAQASYAALLDTFAGRPGVLFVCVTAPPIAPKQKPEPLWKNLIRGLLGRKKDLHAAGRLARLFNNWLSDRQGWLKDYAGKNVVVFDYYDILTGEGKSNLSLYPSGGGWDSHPNHDGNTIAAERFVPFVNRAVRRAGLGGH